MVSTLLYYIGEDRRPLDRGRNPRARFVKALAVLNS